MCAHSESILYYSWLLQTDTFAEVRWPWLLYQCATLFYFRSYLDSLLHIANQLHVITLLFLRLQFSVCYNELQKALAFLQCITPRNELSANRNSIPQHRLRSRSKLNTQDHCKVILIVCIDQLNCRSISYLYVQTCRHTLFVFQTGRPIGEA